MPKISDPIYNIQKVLRDLQLPSTSQFEKDRPKKPGVSTITVAPSNYIIVNDSTLNSNSPSKKSSLIVFDWVNFVEKIMTNGDGGVKRRELFLKCIFNILNRVGHKNTGTRNYENLLNQEINKSLLNFRVNLSNTLGGSSANFSLENFDDKFIIYTPGEFYKQSIIQEGMHFSIDAMGRFESDKFYRIFTGTVTRVNETADPLEKRLDYTCKDYSRYFELTRFNVSPALFESQLFAKQGGPTPFSSVLAGKDGATIVNVLVSTNEEAQADKIYLELPEIWVKAHTKGKGLETDDNGILKEDIKYNYHYVYDKNIGSFNFTQPFEPDFHPKLFVWGHTGSVYQEVFKGFQLFNSEFQTRKDILLQVAGLTYYVCYIDGAGNFHYHPPRFEEEHYLQVKERYYWGNSGMTSYEEHPLVYTLFDDEIIKQSYEQNEDEVCTIARGLAEGNFGLNPQIESKVPNTYRSTIVWEEGINRFGFRERTFSTAALQNSNTSYIDSYTAAFLLRANQERFRMSASMPMRPELQVDRPIYDYNKNMIYQIRNVTHMYNAGGPNSPGTWTTDIVCYAGRPVGTKIASNIFATAADFNSVEAMLKANFTTLGISDLRRSSTLFNRTTGEVKETINGKTTVLQPPDNQTTQSTMSKGQQ